MARFDSLEDWLGWQETLHPDPIDLGLERVGRVAGRLGLLSPGGTVVSVAGTNGKGSSIAMLDAVYRAAGYRTGVYTSPHLLEYNERVCIDGRPVDDARLCAAFERIDAVRDGLSLTYFEFGTLAALEIFSKELPDILLLEVGMGGRLDAVNIIDADVALVTAIGHDHAEWLGQGREAIGCEKAGIFRPGRPAICSDPAPPDSLRLAAASSASEWRALGEHFHYGRTAEGWQWQAGEQCFDALPLPSMGGRQQLDNAAGVIMVAAELASVHPVSRQAIAAGLRSASLPGRCQLVPGRVVKVLDVAHNTESAQQLAGYLADNPVDGETWLVLGMLADKDAAGFAGRLSPCVDHWCLVSLGGARGLSAGTLGTLTGAGLQARLFQDVAAALEYAEQHAAGSDRIVVTGSFVTVAAAMACQV